MRVAGGAEGGRVILEGFKPGTAPPDSYSVIGHSESVQHQDGGGQPAGQGGGFFGQGGLFGGGQQQPGYVPPQRQIRSGTGCLY